MLHEITDFDITGNKNGPILYFVHGWPFHKGQYRKVIPAFEKDYLCVNMNSVGMTDHPVPKNVDYSFEAHAHRIAKLAQKLGHQKITILAHDTGGTSARLCAAAYPDLVERLILFNTEIPNHRPPFVPFYRSSSFLPFSNSIISLMMGSNFWYKSAMGFGNLVYDKALLDGEVKTLFLDHWRYNATRRRQLFKYLQGVAYDVIDDLDNTHQKISAPTIFIWGKNDKTFDCAMGQEMAARMPSCVGFHALDACCFIPMEEKPEESIRLIQDFLLK